MRGFVATLSYVSVELRPIAYSYRTFSEPRTFKSVFYHSAVRATDLAMFFAKLVPFEWRSRRIGVFIFVLVALFRGWWLKRRLALTAIKKLPPSTERHQRARGSRQEPRQQQLQSAAENRQQRQQHSQLNERALASQQTVGRRQPHQSIASKPDLWCAVEAGNACSALDLIKAGHDVNASYKGWTPLT